MSHGEPPPSAAPDGRSRTPTPDPEQGLTGQLLAELEDLRLRLEEAEETIRAIREGEVDAFVVAGPVSERVFTLESTEHPYRRLVEAMHQAALTVTCEGAVLYVNRAFVRTVNIPRETILGRRIHDFFVPASRPTVDEILARGTGGRGEVLLIRGDGHTLPVRMTASECLDEPGIACLVITDLSDQRRLAEVVAAETLSRSILEQTVDAVVVGDPGGTLIRAGTAARRLCGREPIGLSFDEAFPLRRRNDPTGCRLALPLSQVISGQTFRGLEARLEANDGSRTFDLLLSVGPLRDVDGLVVGFVATLTDVTEQKRAEEALLARQRELQTLADNTPEILARFDREFRHVFVNAAVEPALGLRRSQFLGKTHRELEMPEAFCTLWEQALRSVFESGGPASIDFEFATPAGLRHYEARLVPEPGSGTVVESILGLTHDVTDRKRYEQSLRDQDRRKDEFLATLAHELRNPLAAIGNAAHIASLSPEDEGTGTWAIEVIERQARQLKHLVDDLLDVSRINLGKIELRRELVDARAIIERAVEVVKPQVLAKKQTLIVELSEPPLPVDADPTRLEQLVVNLLGNASKYTDHHGRITISARRAGSELVLKVADTGIGIAAKDLHRIFEPFGQVDDSLGRSEGGLGIGLTLVRRLTELHGGRVAVASEGLGRGSVFSVGLPLSQAPLPATSPAPETSRVCPTEAHILIVDDNRDGVTGLARLLRRAGFHVDTAHDGPAALALLGEFPPSVALLDIGLPGMDGYQLAAHLRERYGRSIFLYAVSGYGRESDRDRAERAGFDHYLIKPVDPDQLLSLLTAQAVARPV